MRPSGVTVADDVDEVDAPRIRPARQAVEVTVELQCWPPSVENALNGPAQRLVQSTIGRTWHEHCAQGDLRAGNPLRYSDLL
jgi:hypothetical protein